MFLDRLEVEIVNLDVVVTDAAGDPVVGLTRDDFQLSVDGEPTPIDNFYAVGPLAPGAPAGDGAAAPSLDGAAPSALPEREQELHLLVLFDNVRATPGERQRVVEDLASWFEHGLGVRGQAAVAYYDGGIRIHQPFTPDGAAVATSIRETAGLQLGYSEDFGRRNLLSEIDQVRVDAERIENGAAAEIADSLLVSVRAYAQEEAFSVRRRLVSLAWQVDALAGLPGRKALLYVTSGLDLHPGQAVFAAWRNKFSTLGIRSVSSASGLEETVGGADLRRSLHELTRRANAGDVALYTIGTGATGTSHYFSAEDKGFDIGGLSTVLGGRSYDQALDSAYRANQVSGLELMAAITGGAAATGGADYGRIAQAIEHDAGYHYSLGFRPPDEKPGARQRIEVEVPGRDFRLRYRREFVTSTPAEKASGRTLAALLWDRADNAFGIAADLGPPEPSQKDEDLFVLPVLVKVPFVNLVLLPERRVHRGRITIFVVVEDDKGRLSPVQTIEAPIEIPAARLEAALAGVAGYRVRLLVRPGPHRLAIGVRDEIGDAVSALVLDHDVTAPPGDV